MTAATAAVSARRGLAGHPTHPLISNTCSNLFGWVPTVTRRERGGGHDDRDHNTARNLAALADQAVSGELRPDVKQPAGNPHQTALGGTGYCRRKTQIMSQRRPREVAAP